jgi:membrane protease YdiL (CAAX protease family)
MKNGAHDRPPPSPDNHAPTPHEGRARFRWKYATALAAACAVGAVLFLPYEVEATRLNEEPKGTIAWDSSRFAFIITYKYDDKPGNSRDVLWGPAEAVGAVVLDMCWSLLGIFVGLGLGPSVGLAWPPLAGWSEDTGRLRRVASTLLLATVLGAASVVPLVGVNVALLSLGGAGESGGGLVLPPWYLALPASFGAGIREEVWLRLGFMTAVVRALARLRRRGSPGTATLWSGIILASLLFGALHLPQAFRMAGASGLLMASVLLGGIAIGVVFGWLYWRKGLIAAMLAHATQDVITKVVFPLLGV